MKRITQFEVSIQDVYKEKRIIGHLDESSKALTNPQVIDSLNNKDIHIFSWLLGSIEPHIVNHL